MSGVDQTGRPVWEAAPTTAGPSPYTYSVPGSLIVEPITATATYDGTGAGGQFLCAISLYSQSGNLLSRTFPTTVVSAGEVAHVTFFPSLGNPGSGSATSGGAGLDVPGTYMVPIPSGASQCTIDAVGGGGGGAVANTTNGAAVNGQAGGGGGAYQHLEIPTAAMKSPLTVVVPAGGAGGVPFTSPNGADGFAATVTDANGVVWLTANPGKGAIVNGSGGTGGTISTGGPLTGVAGGQGGATGSSGGAGGNASNVAGGGASGGGAGGGVTGIAGTSNNGGHGGNLTLGPTTVVTGGTAGVAPGGRGGDAPSSVNIYAGAGGGGGAGDSANGVSGGGGGNGYLGGGGGGGGAGGHSAVSAIPGNGGSGFVRVLFV